ncbi:membrane protein [Devosia epidermidihirudinis]|uniref:Membrane protein n=1 Tax=Devosia epidermidihirudinis TaxID=1293439 RepID=A0A0F5Q5G9_9HYPH|nr:membrane protein [Devosia epidermidihirudinis]
MMIVAAVLVALVALIHIYILFLEMFQWSSPRGQKAFGLTPEFARDTKVLAANQGLYNGFLAAGLIWGVLHPDREFGWQICIFFLACVAIAGIYGAATSTRKILLVQTVPALIALVAVIFA